MRFAREVKGRNAPARRAYRGRIGRSYARARARTIIEYTYYQRSIIVFRCVRIRA